MTYYALYHSSSALFMLDMIHSMPSSSPSPLFAEQGWIVHVRSLILGRFRPELISCVESEFNKSCLFAKTNNGTPSNLSSFKS
mmetsp:Transcript_10782/g.22062  ORF Transcript_10782/g.22062 Transcript_10782/m.22062 type:complete len:83 (+) Transcript_10782:3-251(+)